VLQCVQAVVRHARHIVRVIVENPKYAAFLMELSKHHISVFIVEL
jgi:hypothetical protein